MYSKQVRTLEYVSCDRCDRPATKFYKDFGCYCEIHFYEPDPDGVSPADLALDDMCTCGKVNSS